MRVSRNYFAVPIALIAFAMLASAQEQPKKEIKHVRIQATFPALAQRCTRPIAPSAMEPMARATAPQRRRRKFHHPI